MDEFVDAWIVPEIEGRIAEKGVEPNNNEMLFENFIVQGLEHSILTKNAKTEPTCNIELYKGYSILFDTMIKQKILISTHGVTATVDKTKNIDITYGVTVTVDKTKISVDYLRNTLQTNKKPIKTNKKPIKTNKNNVQLEQPTMPQKLMGGALDVISTLPDELKCFTINYNNLSNWLQNYQYRNTDEDEFLFLKSDKQIVEKVEKVEKGGKGEKRCKKRKYSVKKWLNSFRNKTNKRGEGKG